MRRKIEMAVLAGALMVAGVTSWVAAQDVTLISLEDQIKSQYTLVKMGADADGTAVVQEGTVLVVKKDGILGVPYQDQATVSKYQDGVVHSPNAAKGGSAEKSGKARIFAVGTRVYPARIAVNLAKDQVLLSVVSCDACNNVNPTTFYKADVVFQFAKGSLANTSSSEIEDTISGLLALDDGPGDQGGQPGGNEAGGGPAVGQAKEQGSPSDAVQIEKGQTPEQVKAALGRPEKIVNFGSKQIFVYKDLKVTFLDGKVSDVE
jgi:hypothetical protein